MKFRLVCGKAESEKKNRTGFTNIDPNETGLNEKYAVCAVSLYHRSFGFRTVISFLLWTLDLDVLTLSLSLFLSPSRHPPRSGPMRTNVYEKFVVCRLRSTLYGSHSESVVCVCDVLPAHKYNIICMIIVNSQRETISQSRELYVIIRCCMRWWTWIWTWTYRQGYNM